MASLRSSSRTVQFLRLAVSFGAIGCGADDTASENSPQSVGGRSAGAGPSAGSAGQAAAVAGRGAAMMPGIGTMTMTPVGGSAGAPAAGSAGASGAPANGGGAGRGEAVIAGAGGSPAGAAGAAGSGRSGSAGGAAPTDPMDPTSVCAGGTPGMDSDAAMTRSSTSSRNLSLVYLLVSPPNKIVRFQTFLPVPKLPSARNTLFIWPGLQHMGGEDPARIGNGVLQPVLTWGPSCNPKAPAKGNDYMSWWISGMYVNVSTSAAGGSGCAGGEAMDVGVGDRLYIDFSVQGNEWTQTVLNLANMKKVDFKFDLKGQDQNWAIWDIETPGSSRPAEDTFFEKSVLTFASPVNDCAIDSAAEVDYFSAPIKSADGLNCCFEKMTLKAQRN